MPEIELDLRNHCIETAIKRLHNRLLSEYFRSRGNDEGLEDKLALLQNAMVRFDFSALRAAYGELAGNSDARIILTDNIGSMPVIIINGRIADTEDYIKGSGPPLTHG